MVIDDILVFSDTEEEHIKHLEMVFKALKKHGAKINPAKCKFFVKSTIFLGYHLSIQGIKPDPEKMKKIQEWKLPSLSKELRSTLSAVKFFVKQRKDCTVHRGGRSFSQSTRNSIDSGS